MAFWAVAVLTTFTAGGLVAPEHGLRGTYFTSTEWNGPVRLERVDRQLSPELLVEPPLGAWQAYSIDWTGVIRVPAAATYTFATISDDGSEVEVDGQPVVDNRGFHEARKATGTIALAAGYHDLRVRYQQLGGRFVLHLLWAPGEATLRPIQSGVLWPARPTALAALEPWAAMLLGLVVFAGWCAIYLA
ncbi:MAG: PA14 domain-containing protein, partial [Acidobacteriota bacterium]